MGKYIFYISALLLSLAACDKTAKEKQLLSRQERMELRRQDSLALKVGVTPTMDCLPLFVAKERKMFEKADVDVRLRLRNSHLDIDTLLAGGYIEAAATEKVRCARIIAKGTPIDYVAGTNLQWQLITNKQQRIKKLDQLSDKMIAMTRFSATDSLADVAIAKAKAKSAIFKIQVNDVNVRLRMLINNEMDAAFLPEPQATMARMRNHNVVADSIFAHDGNGVLAVRRLSVADKRRQKQLAAFLKAYNEACDSIEKHGLRSYADVMAKYIGINGQTMNKLPKLTYNHAKKYDTKR